MAIYIFVLADPRTLEITYVGRTNTSRAPHLPQSCQAPDSPLQQWMAELRGLDLQPIFRILEETIPAHQHATERYWIAYFAKHNRLLNLLPSGVTTCPTP